MKKFVGVFKILLFYMIGYIIFTTITFLIEVFFLWKLSGSVFNIHSILTRNFCGNWLSYSIIFVVILVLNVLYNYISVRRLNEKLNRIKKG